MTLFRWWLSEWLFRLSYRACPDKKAYDFLLKHGADQMKACSAALRDRGGGVMYRVSFMTAPR